ncbi:hypothetical protein [Streptomyces coffeae]|uniref:FXSXX-COOH protein n=1 Tax=Streptomyces coffeae TaxID=621382 RepID=A0ABS1NKQ7_9ACTN|nr:hypothetical protein [Streptomyces coffeae]MBL1100655.1 hypothetical protein [Streptomyces coffeae]
MTATGHGSAEGGNGRAAAGTITTDVPFLAVPAERRSLEDIAEPLSARAAAASSAPGTSATSG